jgi:hypothetical protein
MMSNEDELYTKVVVLDDIYNFVLQTFLIWDHLDVQTYTISIYQSIFKKNTINLRSEHRPKWKQMRNNNTMNLPYRTLKVQN